MADPTPFTDRPDDLTVGILGGMGPRATVDFFRELVALTDARKDWNHLHIVVDNNPRLPSRSRAWLFGEASPAPWLAQGAQRLLAAGARLLAVPCNSAAYYLGEARAAVAVPILDPVDATARAIVARGGLRRPFVMGGAVTFGAKLYDAALVPHGITPMWPEPGEQEETQALIEALKSEDRVGEVTARAARLIDTAIARGADAAILGCTEFGMIAAGLARTIHGPTEHGRRGASSRRSEEGVGSCPITDERRTDAQQIGGQATEAHELSGLHASVPVFNSNAELAALVVRMARGEQ